MPVMDGFDASKLINEFYSLQKVHNNKYKIIILTAFVDSQGQSQADSVGADYYLRKPLSESKLTSILSKMS